MGRTLATGHLPRRGRRTSRADGARVAVR